MSVEISSTRREVKIPPLNVDPLAGKSGSKGVAELRELLLSETSADCGLTPWTDSSLLFQ